MAAELEAVLAEAASGRLLEGRTELAAQTVFALVTSVIPWLKKDAADEELYDGAFAVLDSLDATRSCCLVAELTNNAFAAHARAPEAQLLSLVNAIFDMLWCGRRACATPRAAPRHAPPRHAPPSPCRCSRAAAPQ